MTLNRRHVLAISAAAAAAAGLPFTARATQEIGGLALGSYWRGHFHLEAPADEIRHLVNGIVAEVDAQMSPYQPDSDLSQFNRALAGAQDMPPDLVEVARAALLLAHRTGGAFDPTVGPTVARYGFGPIAGARSGTWHGLEIGERHILKSHPDLTLDLCGIAKGHALDRLMAALAQAGLRDFIVELGGEVAVNGRHPDGRPWQVGVEDAHGGLAGVALLDHGWSVATSGNGAQSYQMGDFTYGHIIDPRTDGPSGTSLASVSVFAETAMQADGLATALFVMGAEPARAYAEAEGLHAALVRASGDLVLTGQARRFVRAGGQG